LNPLIISEGWIKHIKHEPSAHFNIRENSTNISLLVVHNISLPPGEFGGPYITDLFMGRLNKDDDPYFEDIAHLQVSAHCLIRRDGEIIQYVSFNDRAWHAGVSSFKNIENCNDFSIGIELEGTDDVPYTDVQYMKLSQLTQVLQIQYPSITADNIVGHCDIAPGRKTDPGKSFDWKKYKTVLLNLKG